MGLLDVALRSVAPELQQATGQIATAIDQLNAQLTIIAQNTAAVAARLDRQDRALTQVLALLSNMQGAQHERSESGAGGDTGG